MDKAKEDASSVILDLTDRVSRACRVLGALDLTVSILGHVSARVPGKETLLIRARGEKEPGVRYTTKDLIMEVGFDGKPVPGQESIKGLTVPQEIYIHTSIYETRPDVHSVLHIHPETVVLFSICNQPLLPIYGGFEPFGLRFAAKGVPVYDRTILITTPELGHDLASAMGDASICIMRGHGITTAANSIEEAAVYAIALNDLARMNYRAVVLGGAQVISQEDQKQMLETLGARGLPVAGHPPSTVAAIWRYYLNLTGNASD